MKRSNRLILLIGFFLAAVAFVGIILLVGGGGGGGGDQTDVGMSTYVVAAVDIPLGTTITADLVKTEPVKTTDKPTGSFTLTSEVVGRTTTTTITAGQLASEAWFSNTTTDAAQIGRNLGTGRRAMSVQVDQVSGVGTLVRPGDRVDVVIGIAGADKFPVVTADPQTGQLTVVPGINATSVKAIIQNLEVVGTLLPPPTDQGTNQDQNAQSGDAPALNGQAQIVILSVSAQEAEVLRFGQIDGTITLVLRSPDDSEAPSDVTTGITLRQLVDAWSVIPPQIVETVLPTQNQRNNP